MRGTIIGVVATLAALGGGMAFASIPDSGGVIHACYSNGKGALRVVDLQGGDACAKKESALNWSQAGPKGDRGEKGERGDRGETGPQGPAADFGTGVGLEKVTLTAPPPIGDQTLLQLTPPYRLPQGCTPGSAPVRSAAGSGWACGNGAGGGPTSHAYVGRGGGVISGAGAVVASVDVPPGSYVISGKVSLTNLDNDSQDASCRLSTGDVSPLRLGGVGGASEEIGPNVMAVSVADTAALGGDTTITMHCSTFDGLSTSAVLTAIAVGGIG